MRKRFNRYNIGLYPRLFGLPLGVTILSIVTSLTLAAISLASKSMVALLFTCGLWVVVLLLNKRFDGNFFFTKKKETHDYILTAQYMRYLSLSKPNNHVSTK